MYFNRRYVAGRTSKMYKIEINSRISQIFKVFHLFGMWRVENQSSVYREGGRKLLYSILHGSFGVSMIFGGLSCDNINELIFLVSGGVGTVLQTFMLMYILFKKNEIQALIESCGIHYVANNEEFIKFSDKIKKLISFSSGLVLVIYLSVGALFISSLPVFSHEKRLPLNIWFPLDWKNDVICYWIAFSYVMIFVTISTVAVLLNILIWYLMTNCAVKYQLLGNRLKGMFLTKPITENQTTSESPDQKLFLQETIVLIKSHRNIQGTVRQVKTCFEHLFFAKITTGGICICGSVYSLAYNTYYENVVSMALSLINLALMLNNIFDIFMLMYLGNEIKLSSDRLSYCLFESNWLEQSTACKKTIIILTEFLKQPQELLVGKLYPMDMNCFASIVKLAYSTFNILTNLK